MMSRFFRDYRPPPEPFSPRGLIFVCLARAWEEGARGGGEGGLPPAPKGGWAMSKRKIQRVVLAHSGGLDTSVIVPWLRENYGCEVVCFTADIGQGDELTGLEAKALASGASQFVQRDLREEFARDYLLRLLRSGAVYERKYLLGTSIARPLIARHQVELAHEVGADAVAHGATGKGNDQVRFELTYAALDPRLAVIAPWREWELTLVGNASSYDIPNAEVGEPRCGLQCQPRIVFCAGWVFHTGTTLHLHNGQGSHCRYYRRIRDGWHGTDHQGPSDDLGDGTWSQDQKTMGWI